LASAFLVSVWLLDFLDLGSGIILRLPSTEPASDAPEENGLGFPLPNAAALLNVVVCWNGLEAGEGNCPNPPAMVDAGGCPNVVVGLDGCAKEKDGVGALNPEAAGWPKGVEGVGVELPNPGVDELPDPKPVEDANVFWLGPCPNMKLEG